LPCRRIRLGNWLRYGARNCRSCANCCHEINHRRVSRVSHHRCCENDCCRGSPHRASCPRENVRRREIRGCRAMKRPPPRRKRRGKPPT
jgi:hypothetical protein